MASARVKALGSLASVVCASVLVLACTPTTPGPNPTPSSSGSAPAEQASRVVVDGPVTAVKGKTIVPLCNGVPAPERVVTEKVRVAITPPATVVLPIGARFTVCAPAAYQPTKPVPADRTPVKVRMYYTNPWTHIRNSGWPDQSGGQRHQRQGPERCLGGGHGR